MCPWSAVDVDSALEILFVLLLYYYYRYYPTLETHYCSLLAMRPSLWHVQNIVFFGFLACL